MTTMTSMPRTADVVVVGGGTIGAWAAWFLERSGVGDVVLVERDTLGQGASSRAAGMVRAQGGTEWAVRLGMFSREFYAGQQDLLGIDSGFVAQGYFMPVLLRAGGRARRTSGSRCSRRVGLDVRWVEPDEVDAMNPAMAPGQTLGASYSPSDGYIDPPRNVLAYTAAILGAGVRVCERTAFTGLLIEGGRVDRRSHVGRRRGHLPGGAHRRSDAGRRRSGGGRHGSRPAVRGTRSS